MEGKRIALLAYQRSQLHTTLFKHLLLLMANMGWGSAGGMVVAVVDEHVADSWGGRYANRCRFRSKRASPPFICSFAAFKGGSEEANLTPPAALLVGCGGHCCSTVSIPSRLLNQINAPFLQGWISPWRKLEFPLCSECAAESRSFLRLFLRFQHQGQEQPEPVKMPSSWPGRRVGGGERGWRRVPIANLSERARFP